MSSRAIHVAYRPFLMSVLAFECLLAQSAPAQIDYFPDIPTGTQGVAFQTVTSGIRNTSNLQEFPDGSGRLLTNRRDLNRLYVVQPSGSNADFLRACPCETAGTEGLPSFAFHPGFADINDVGYGKFYTLTVDTTFTFPADFSSPGEEAALQSVLSEWTMDDISADVFEGSQRVLMRVQIQTEDHAVNDLAFGPDENLYIALGEDNVNRELAGSTDTIFGKILRIDPFGNNSANGQYGIPADNPFVDEPGAAGEVYAYGLRNPWRIWFDPVSGDLFAGDVGWRSIEEVDRIVSGGNYGWPIKEGSLLAAKDATPDVPDPITGLTKAQELGLMDPLFEYDHTDGLSVIGGVVYRGSELPWLNGKVIFSDWESLQIMAGDPETGEFFQLPLEGNAVSNALGGGRIVSINEDLDGELYLLGGGQNIVRITPLPGDINRDGTVGADDIDQLYASLGSGDPRYDLDNDGVVDAGDVDELVLNIPDTTYGDANLDGMVNEDDFEIWNSHVFEASAGWAGGNFNGDIGADGSDFNILFPRLRVNDT